MDILERVFTYKDNYVLPDITTAAFMDELENMECREDDIFIVTYPKSGTHWMQEIVQLILVDGHLEQLSSDRRMMVLELANVASLNPEDVLKAGPVLRQVKDLPSPRVLTTHVHRNLLPRHVEEKGCKVIYVLRHPKDVIVSYYNFNRKVFIGAGIPCEDTPEFFERFFKKVITGKFEYGSWWEHVLGYNTQRSNKNYFFTTFEKMNSDITQVVTDVASFIGRQLSEESLDRAVRGVSLGTMRQSYQQEQTKNEELEQRGLDANSYISKGTVGQWRDRFTTDQNSLFNEMFISKMHDCELAKHYNME